jgi:hypothetical protein
MKLINKIICFVFLAIIVTGTVFMPKVQAQTSTIDCSRTSTSLVPVIGYELPPLMDMRADQDYYGENGGLYGDGKNDPPPLHYNKALSDVSLIRPLNQLGEADPDGKIGLISIGMSNTRREFDIFMQLATASAELSPSVVLVNGALGANTASRWATLESPWTLLSDAVKAASMSAQQVQAVWLKQANANPTGDDMVYATKLKNDMRVIVKKVKDRYPNVRIIYLSSRIYAGYALAKLNPEPYAYSSGFAVRNLIKEQISQSSELNYENAPVLVWGPYIWANGLIPRSDGLIWQCDEFEPDGTHPAEPGKLKVANILFDYFTQHEFTKPWFTLHVTPSFEPAPSGLYRKGDVDQSGLVDEKDFSLLLNDFGSTESSISSYFEPVTDEKTNMFDIAWVVRDWLLQMASPTPTGSPMETPIPTPTESPEASPSPGPTASPLPSPTESPVPSPSPTDSPTPTPSPSDDPPTVVITSPQNSSVILRNSNLTIIADATDDIGVNEVVFVISESSRGQIFSCTDNEAPYECAWFVPGKPNVEYVIEAIAYDSSGHTSVNSVTVISSN